MNTKELAYIEIEKLVNNFKNIPVSQRRGMNEMQTRLGYILPLFRALGWDTSNINEVSPEEKVSRGWVDFSFRIGNVPRFFLETKRVNEDLNDPKWVKQSIDYAWTKSVTWALLSDFEGLRVFNAEWKEANPFSAQFIEFDLDSYLTDFERLWWLSKPETIARRLDLEAEKVGKKIKRLPVSQNLFDDLKKWRQNLFKNYKAFNLGYSAAQVDEANLSGADLSISGLPYRIGTKLYRAQIINTNLSYVNFNEAYLENAYFNGANLVGSNFSKALVGETTFVNTDLSQAIQLENVGHWGPSSISTDTLALSKGRIPKAFLRGCGLSDWEIESAKLYDPDLSNEDINKLLYRIYDLRATQALQISPLFISYSHANGMFVDKLEHYLNSKGIRFWRDVHDMKSGRIETQIDRAIQQNPTVLLILSEHSLKSDWVEHEVRTARELEKEMGRDILCPVALDDSWKNSPWPKRVMEQVMEYNILDFSAWQDDSKFGSTFNKLIDGLELFYKG